MCLDGAGCGLTCRSAEAIMAGCVLAWLYALWSLAPVWLPAISLAALMFECFWPETDP